MHGLNHRNNLSSLRHYDLFEKLRMIIAERGLIDTGIEVQQADFGSTTITLNEDSTVSSLKVSGYSIDFGRADTEGRQQTCELFESRIGKAVEVVNLDPSPGEREKIIPSEA